MQARVIHHGKEIIFEEKLPQSNVLKTKKLSDAVNLLNLSQYDFDIEI